MSVHRFYVTAVRSALLLGIVAWTTIGAAPARSQQTIPELDVIKTAIAAGDAGRLMSVTSDRVEMALMGASRQYSRAQAGLVLKRFFDEYAPRSFEVVDSTRSTRGLFIEGRIRTKDRDRPLRVYLRLNRMAEAWTLREMLVERADR